MHPWLSDALHIVAYTTIVLFGPKVLYGLANLVYVHLLTRPKDLRKLAGCDWALVTGASDGIGAAYAEGLAARGFHLLLVSRSASKLERVRGRLQQRFDVQVEVVAFDFAQASFHDYERILFPAMADLDIGCLVNNVGQMHAYPERLHEFPGGVERVFDVATVNTVPAAVLSARVLPAMVTRGAGIIVNISSASAYHEMERWSVYSATKRFVTHFTRCLAKEYGKLGISVQAVHPMFVATAMTGYASGVGVLSAEAVASGALGTVGYTTETAGTFLHELQSLGFPFPGFFVDPFVRLLSAAQKRQVLARLEHKDDQIRLIEPITKNQN